MATRPLGVTIICILGWLGAILSIVGGLALLGLSSLSGAFAAAAMGQVLGSLVSVYGALVIIVSAVSIIALYWLWNMMKKGWNLTMILEVIGVVFGVIQIIYNPISVFGLAIPAIIVIYLWMNKNLFK
jgi:hypothetical protein